MISICKRVDAKNVNMQTLFNIISMIIRGGISYLTMPIFTRMLGAEQYGFFSIYLSWCSIFACFIGLQCGASLGTRFYRYDDYDDYKRSLFTFCLISSVALLFVAAMFLDSLERIIELPKLVIVLMMVDSTTTFIISYFSNAYIYEKKAEKNLVIAVINASLGVVLSISLIKFWKSEDLYVARALGLLIPSLLVCLVISFEFYKEGQTRLNIEYIKYGLRFGFPLLFHMLSQLVLSQSDRIMMQKMGTSKSDIGAYSFAYSFSMLLLTILNAIGNGWSPFLYEGLKKRNYERLNKGVRNYAFLFASLCCGFLLVSKEVGEMFGGNEFSNSLKMIPVFVLSVYSVFIYQFAVNFEGFVEQPRYIAIMTIISAIINIALNYFLIPISGIFGAALATLISYIILSILHTVLIRIWKYERYPLRLTPVFYYLIVVVLASIVFYALSDFVIIRWSLAITLGIYMIFDLRRRRSVF